MRISRNTISRQASIGTANVLTALPSTPRPKGFSADLPLRVIAVFREPLRVEHTEYRSRRPRLVGSRGRGDAAAATRSVCGDGTRRRFDADGPRRRRDDDVDGPRRGRGRDVNIPRRRDAAAATRIVL